MTQHSALRTHHSAPGMPLVPALTALRDFRTDEIVITTMGSAREWPKLSDDPLDLVYVPSSMGQAPTLGLGLALALPQRRVIVVNGDGCMLMNLGCLVTITAESPPNYALIVINNGVYEVTGGQPTAAAHCPLPTAHFSALARAAGFERVYHFRDLESWRSGIRDALAPPGPVFACLDCIPEHCEVAVTAPSPMRERLARFRAALGV